MGGSKLILTNVCMASGREIGAADNVQACKSCNHRSIVGELRGRATCPICHSLFVKRGAAGDRESSMSAVNKSPTAPSYGRGLDWDAT